MNRRFRRLPIYSKKKTGDRWNVRGALTPSSSDHDWQTFEASLQQLEIAVQALRQRFNHVSALQHRQEQLEQRLQTPNLPIEELQRLKQQLNELESQLESLLFDWRSLQEPFWQAVRFGGLGIVIGWILRGIASG